MNNIRINLVAVLILCGLIHAQDFTGNYEVNYIDVNYIVTVRDTVQQDANGDDFTLETDALADYSIYMGWPMADDDEGWVDYPLITFEPGDTAGALANYFPTPEWLAAAGIALNVDLNTNGNFTINEGSTYPTTNLVDCVTVPSIPGVSENGTWTDGGFDGIQNDTDHSYTIGWGIVESGVFAHFIAPDLGNWTYGTEYGFGTENESWGRLISYYDDTWTNSLGVDIYWQAIDGPASGLGVVDPTDTLYTPETEGSLNSIYGTGTVPGDSITILLAAAAAANYGLTINVPADNPPYMFGGEGGAGTGTTNLRWGYVFDPSGDLIGGGDGELFSGDEGLQFTGYYLTYNFLNTALAIQEGVEDALFYYDPPLTTLAEIVEVCATYVFTAWNISEALQNALLETAVNGILAELQPIVDAYVAAGMSEFDAIVATLGISAPIVLGALTAAETTLGITVDDSDHDLSTGTFYDFDCDYDGDIDDDDCMTSDEGGRMYFEIYNTCLPTKWTQIIDSHWNNTEFTSVDHDAPIARSFELLGNYPNPFNPSTKIRFATEKHSDVKVNIYSVVGKEVSSIINHELAAGTYNVTWNGTDRSGARAPSGMYFYEVSSDDRTLVGKMLLLK
tara:strand:+ start:4603 stop:6462 length:1860 start_codon:yes stop_codon:yes gene_type:complete